MSPRRFEAFLLCRATLWGLSLGVRTPGSCPPARLVALHHPDPGAHVLQPPRDVQRDAAAARHEDAGVVRTQRRPRGLHRLWPPSSARPAGHAVRVTHFRRNLNTTSTQRAVAARILDDAGRNAPCEAGGRAAWQASRPAARLCSCRLQPGRRRAAIGPDPCRHRCHGRLESKMPHEGALRHEAHLHADLEAAAEELPSMYRSSLLQQPQSVFQKLPQVIQLIHNSCSQS